MVLQANKKDLSALTLFVLFLSLMCHNVDAQLSSPVFNTMEEIEIEENSFAKLDYSLISARYGFLIKHRYSSTTISSIKESISASLCVFDANNDGFQDILIADGGGFQREFGRPAWWSRTATASIFINYYGQYFLPYEVQTKTKLDSVVNCRTGDLDDDGDEDFILTSLDGHRLFKNNSVADTMDVAFSYAGDIKTNAFPIHTLLLDANNDAQLDIYSSHFIAFAKGKKTAQTNQGFEAQNEVNFKADLFDSVPNQLFINNDDWIYDEVSSDVLNTGIGRSLSSYLVDLDFDGNQDVFVANGFASRSRLFLNNKETFREASDHYRSLLIDNSHVAAFSKRQPQALNSDYLLYIGRSAGASSQLLSKPTSSRHWQNVEDPITSRRGALHLSEWGVAARDLDYNGYVDFFIGNGQVVPRMDSSHLTTQQHNRVLFQTKSKQFIEKEAESHRIQSASTRGVAFIDVNNDGTFELLSANNNDWYRLEKISLPKPKKWIGLQFPRSHRWLNATVQVISGEEVYEQVVSFEQQGFAQGDNRLVFTLDHPDTSDYSDMMALDIVISKSGYEDITLATKNVNQYLRLNVDDEGKFSLAEPKERRKVRSMVGSDIDSFSRLSPRQQLYYIRQKLDMPERLIPELDRDWEEISDDTKREIIEEFQLYPTWLVAFIIEKFIQYEPEKFESTLVNYLLKSEIEFATHWAIPFVISLSDDIFCDAMEVLKKLFHEEEAMLLTKQLYISPLLRRYSVATSVERNCLLKTLGESENQRATVFLLSEFDKELDHVVKANIIEALGNLRDARASTLLLTILRESQSSELLATTLVAATRMQIIDFDSVVNDLEARLDTQSALRLFTSLLRNVHFEVFLVQQKSTLAKWFSRLSVDIIDEEQQRNRIISHLLTPTLIQQLADLHTPQVEANTLKHALLNLKKINTSNSEILLSDLSPPTLVMVSEYIKNPSLTMTFSHASSLLNKWYDQYGYSSWLNLLHTLESNIVTRYLLIATEMDGKPQTIFKDIHAKKLDWSLIVTELPSMEAATQVTLLQKWFSECIIGCVKQVDKKQFQNRVALILRRLDRDLTHIDDAYFRLLLLAGKSQWQTVLGIIERRHHQISSEDILAVIQQFPEDALNQNEAAQATLRNIDKHVLSKLAQRKNSQSAKDWYIFERKIAG